MDITDAELDKVALTRRQKEVAFDAAVRSSEGDLTVNLPCNTKAAVKALKIIELQGGKRPNCIRRFWDWLRA